LAGAFPQVGWNTLDDAYGFTPANVGESSLLGDTNFTTTTVTISFNANDSWYNDVTPSTLTTPNAKLMNGIIKSNGGDGVSESFHFNNLPDGTYDLYVYLTMNGDGVHADVSDNDNITTYYINEWHQFSDTNTFVQATNTNPAGVRDTGNYVVFKGLGTFGRGSLGATVTRRGTAGDGTGVPAIQIVPTGPPQSNSIPLSFLTQPISHRGAQGYSNATFSVSVKGPAFSIQWLKNGTAVPGETGLSYTPAPIMTADNGATISVKLTNNLTTLTSSNAVLTVGQFINGGTTVMDGGIVTIKAQPQSVSLVAGEGGAATFTVTATSGYIGEASSLAPPITYQWQSAPKASSTFTAITDATNATYTTPLPSVADDGTQFRVVVSASDATVNSAIAVMTVLPDTIPPTVNSATAFSGSTQVGIEFSEALDPVSATTAANYKVNGAAVAGVFIRTNVANELTSEQNLVSVIAAAPITGAFTLTVSGVKDTSGNAMPSTTVNGSIIQLTSTPIGSPAGQPGGPDPQIPTIITNWGKGNFDVLCNGNDYWNNADGLNFLWQPRTNSFDVKVRVVSVSPINNWSAGAIMLRETLPTATNSELSRHYFCKVDYGGPGSVTVLDNSGKGANSYEYNSRQAPGDPTLRETSNNGPGGSRGWGGTAGPGGTANVPFPDAWIRIARIKSGSSDHLKGYRGTDGSNWLQVQDVDLNDANHAGFVTIGGTNAGPFPDVVYLGLGSVSHTGIGNNNATNAGTVGEFPYSLTGDPYRCWVIYRSFGEVSSQTPQGPTIVIVKNADGTATMTYTGNLYSSTTVSGTYAKVAGASSPFTVNPKTSGNAATFYRAGP
jgi:hypothetical protein